MCPSLRRSPRNTPVVALTLLIASAWTLAARGADEKPVPLPVAELKRDTQVDFEQELLPILTRSCLACHNATDSENNVVLETPQTIAKGSAEGPIVVAGKSAESKLFAVAAHTAGAIMPPAGNKVGAAPLKPEELALLKLWIEQGAKGEVKGQGLTKWQPLPAGVNPIYATAISSDGQTVACSRANQVFLYHGPSGLPLGRLTDPELLKAGIYANAGVADIDLIESLAFSPDGERVAAGGFRTAKIWRRPHDVMLAEVTLSGEAARSLAASPDGKFLAIGDVAGKIAWVDAATKQLVRTLAGHAGPVNSLAISADGGRLYSAGEDKIVRVWNTADGAQLGQWSTPAPVAAALLVSGGSQLATAHGDNIIRTWNVSAALPNDAGATPVPVKEFKGHTGPVTCLAIASADGKQFASGSRDSTLRIWNVDAGNQLRELNHGGPILAIALRADSKRIVTSGENSTVRVWDGDNNQALAENRGNVWARLKFERATRVAAATKARLEDRKQAVPVAEMLAKTEADNVKKATDSKMAAEKTAGEKQEAAKKPTAERMMAEQALADAKTASAKAIADKPVAEKAFTDAQAALDRAKLAKQTADKQLADAQAASNAANQGKAAAEQTAKQRADEAKKAADALAAAKAAAGKDAQNKALADAAAAAEKASSDAAAKQTEAQTLLTAAATKATDAATALKTAQEAQAAADKSQNEANTARNNAEQAKQKAIAAVPQSEEKIRQSEQKLKQATEAFQKADGEVQTAQSAVVAAVKAIETATAAAKAATDAVPVAQQAVAAADAAVKQADADVEAAKAASAASEKPRRALAISADGLRIAAASDDGVVHLYSTATGAQLDTLTLTPAPGAPMPPVAAVAFMKDGSLVSAADKRVVRWDITPAWQHERTIGKPEDGVTLADRVLSLAFSPDGKLLATGSGQPSRSGQVKLWNVADGSLAAEFADAHSDTVYSLDFSPDGQFLATAAADRFMKVWNVGTQKLARTFEGHTGHVLGVTWKSDGKRLASCSADASIKIWDAASGEQVRSITGGAKEIISITFIGDGDEVISANGEGAARVNRAGDGGGVRNYGSSDFQYSVAASDDGKLVVTGGQDSTLRIWNGQQDNKVLFEIAAPK